MNVHCFMLGFNALSLSATRLSDCLDKQSEVSDFYSILPGQIFVVSTLDSVGLRELIDGAFPGELFVVIEFDPRDADGRLPQEAWDVVNQPLGASDYASVSTEPTRRAS